MERIETDFYYLMMLLLIQECLNAVCRDIDFGCFFVHDQEVIYGFIRLVHHDRYHLSSGIQERCGQELAAADTAADMPGPGLNKF